MKRTSLIKRVQVLLHPELHQKLKIHATINNTTISEILDTLVEKYLQKIGKEC